MMPSLSRSWAWPVAGLVALCAGCGAPRDPEARLAKRTEQVVDDLQRLKPRLAKAGTPDADGLAASLAAVREGLATLPASTAAPATAVAVMPAMAVRCPDEGCWRVGVQAEVAAWHVRLRGGGGELDDVGPAALGLALAVERASPLDARGEWSWGGEFAATHQDRRGGQQISLIGVRPLVRFAVAIDDRLAFTIRPLIEVGQASVKLGSAPAGVLDRSDVYIGFGGRLGLRWQVGGGDLTGEVGWRRAMFNGSAGTIDYRVEAGGPEAAVGWAWRL